MSILIRFAPASMTAPQYDETVRRLGEVGDWPPDGLEYHVCFGTDPTLRVSEIWDSREQLDAFGERLRRREHRFEEGLRAPEVGERALGRAGVARGLAPVDLVLGLRDHPGGRLASMSAGE